MDERTGTSESPPSLSDVASLSEGSDADTLSLSSGTSSEEGGVRLDASEHGWDPLPSSHNSKASSSSHHLDTSSSSHASGVPRHTHSAVPQPTPEPPAQSTPEQSTTPETACPVEELARSAARLGELGPLVPSGKRQEREAATQTDSPEHHDARAGSALYDSTHFNCRRRITESPTKLDPAAEERTRARGEGQKEPGQSSSE
jgi:hypothetical protein